MKLSIIIPIYNEEENIKELLEILLKVVDNYKINSEIIIIDNNSEDNTIEIAKEVLKNFKGKVIYRNGNKDLVSSVIEGFKLVNSEIIGVMDADLSHPPQAIPLFLKAIDLEGVDFAIGSRYIKGASIEGWPLYRRVISKTGCFLARISSGIKVKDMISGFFFFKKDIIDGVTFEANGFKVCLELLTKGRYNRLKEIPYEFVNRKKGKSKLTFKIMWHYLIQIYKILIFRLSHNKLDYSLNINR